MNEHLRPIFAVVLPAIKSAGIKYWVYGGVAIAAVYGEFFRLNRDVDIFVLSENFESVKSKIKELIDMNKWKIKDILNNNRPKLELWVGSKECLSLVPVYKLNGEVEFRFGKNSKKIPTSILQQVSVRLDDFDFFIPSNELVKSLFIAYLENRKDLRLRQRADAEKILSTEEFKKYYA